MVSNALLFKTVIKKYNFALVVMTIMMLLTINSFAQDPANFHIIYGNRDGSTIEVYLGQTVEIPCWGATSPPGRGADSYDTVYTMHNPLLTDDNIITGRLGGNFAGSNLTYWDDASFLPPNSNADDPIVPIGFTNQSMLGNAYITDPPDKQYWLWTGGDTVLLGTFLVSITSDGSYGDQTLCPFSLGHHQDMNSLNWDMSDGSRSVTPTQSYGCLHINPWPTCDFIAGDVNNDGDATPLADLIYLYNYFRAIGPPPPLDCNAGNPPPCNVYAPEYFYAAADVNGSCQATGIDIAYGVHFWKGHFTQLLHCLECGNSNPDPQGPPTGIDINLPDSIFIGNTDLTPIMVSIGETISVPVYVKNDENVVGLNIPLAADSQYVVNWLGGSKLSPLSFWNDCSFPLSEANQPFGGYKSQSLLGWHSIFSPVDSQYRLNTNGDYQHVATFTAILSSDTSLVGDTIPIIAGTHSHAGGMAFADSTGIQEWVPRVVFSKMIFTGFISGTITDQTGVPIAGTIVKATATNKVDTTDSNGEYFFGGMIVGTSNSILYSHPYLADTLITIFIPEHQNTTVQDVVYNLPIDVAMGQISGVTDSVYIGFHYSMRAEIINQGVGNIPFEVVLSAHIIGSEDSCFYDTAFTSLPQFSHRLIIFDTPFIPLQDTGYQFTCYLKFPLDVNNSNDTSHLAITSYSDFIQCPQSSPDNFNLECLSNFVFPGYALSCFVLNNHEFIPVAYPWQYYPNLRGLYIINNENQIHPVIDTVIVNTVGAIFDQVILDTLAYIAGNEAGLQILNISSPKMATIIGNYVIFGAYLEDINVEYPYAYLAYYNAGLQIVDISDPTSPILVGSCAQLEHAAEVAKFGNYVYVADQTSNLKIVNVSNPANPTLTGSYETTFMVNDIKVSGQYAYLVDGPNLEILDISNPTDPVMVGSFNDFIAQFITIVGSYVYLAGDAVEVIDVSEPSSPVLAGRYSAEVQFGRIYVNDNFIYTASFNIPGPNYFSVLSLSGYVPPRGTITGTIRRSDNNNAIWNASVTTEHTTTITDAQGRYTLSNIREGVRDLICSKRGYESVTVAGVQVLAGETTFIDAAISPLPRDLSVDLWSEGRARSGFDMSLICHYSSIGLEPSDSVNLKVVIPTEVTYLSSQPAGQISGDTINWNLGTLNAGASASVRVNINVPSSVPSHTMLEAFTSITASDPESLLTNNYDTETNEVVNSWDPNDKQADPMGKGLDNFISDAENLKYTIFFENTGTGEAVNIQIIDTIDTDLDWSSVTFGPMSHPGPCTSYFTPQTGVITWTCDSIMLPPNTNPPQGEGFVTFEAYPSPIASTGTKIQNRAAIQFDYNPWMYAPEDSSYVIRTIDNDPPQTNVLALLPQLTTDTFTVSWMGLDNSPGVGLERYEIYASTNNEPYELWLHSGADQISHIFNGAMGNCYVFYSIGYDSVGNKENPPINPDAQTCILGQGCSYLSGDINNNGSVNGVDIVFAVNYLKGGPNHPPVDCFPNCPSTANPFYAAADVNGNCTFNGIDITYFVRYLKLQVPNLLYCPDCPPAGNNPPVPAVRPIRAPVLRANPGNKSQSTD